MAKKSDAKPTAELPERRVAGKENSLSSGERARVRADKKDSLATSDGERVAEGRVRARPSSLLDTRVVYCGDNLEQLAKLPDACIDLIYIDPPFNSNRNYEVFWGETREKRAFEDRHESTRAYIDYMRPCVKPFRDLVSFFE
jgi:16S rRNA G966 N2-methylase RsmD